MSKPENPAAFPFAAEYGHPAACGGMTLRDYFAGQIIAGWMHPGHVNPYGFAWDPQGISERVYQLADAMLAARGEA